MTDDPVPMGDERDARIAHLRAELHRAELLQLERAMAPHLGVHLQRWLETAKAKAGVTAWDLVEAVEALLLDATEHGTDLEVVYGVRSWVEHWQGFVPKDAGELTVRKARLVHDGLTGILEALVDVAGIESPTRRRERPWELFRDLLDQMRAAVA